MSEDFQTFKKRAKILGLSGKSKGTTVKTKSSGTDFKKKAVQDRLNSKTTTAPSSFSKPDEDLKKKVARKRLKA